MNTVKALLRKPLPLTAVITLVVFLTAAVFGSLLVPHDPELTHLDRVNAGPSSTFWLGTDGSGRDILSRLIISAQLTLVNVVVAVCVSVVIAVPLGLVAGYYKGRLDAALTWIASLIMSLPAMILLLVVSVAVSNNLTAVMAAFGVLSAPGLYRLVRGQVQQVRQEDFVDAAIVSAVTDRQVLTRHILRSVGAPVLIAVGFEAAAAVAIQAGLQFIGLSNPTVPTWGAMLSSAFDGIYQQPLAIIWPGGAIVLVISAFILLATGLRDVAEHPSDNASSSPRRALRGSSPGVRRTVTTADIALGTTDPAVMVADLSVNYGGEAAVTAASLSADRGKVLGIVGESGSGKTQIALSLLGLLPPAADTSGAISLRGRVGYIPQEPMSNLDPAFKVGEHVAEPLRVSGMSRKQAREHTLELFRQVQISDPEAVAEKYPFQISGGMAQRVLIAGALANSPDILIADEPTTALDVSVQAVILDLLRNLQRELELTVVMITHDLGVVADLCDDVVVMKSGRVLETGSVEKVFSTPAETYTAELIALARRAHDLEPDRSGT